MNKKKLRCMINHWDSVWYHYRHHTDLLPKDKIITKFLVPGCTLAWNSFGARYQQHFSNMVVYENLLDQRPDIDGTFQNILMLNVFELRYNSVTHYADTAKKLCSTLNQKGRLIMGINTIFLHWNRTAFTAAQAFEQLISAVQSDSNLQLIFKFMKPFQTDALNGDCLLVFEKQ